MSDTNFHVAPARFSGLSRAPQDTDNHQECGLDASLNMSKADISASTTDSENSADRLAHDLNNLLGIVLGFTDMVIEDLPPGDPRHEDLLEIRKATQSAIGLVERFRAATRAHTQT